MSRTLVAPTARLHDAWLEAHAEWGPGLHEDGFGLDPFDEVESVEGFAAWVARLAERADRATFRWILEGDRLQGAIVLRHQVDERTGHIGYGIRPSARGKGLATWALGRILEGARARGMDRVLLVCADDNAASVGTIERNGGVLDAIQLTTYGPTRRYWVDLTE